MTGYIKCKCDSCRDKDCKMVDQVILTEHAQGIINRNPSATWAINELLRCTTKDFKELFPVRTCGWQNVSLTCALHTCSFFGKECPHKREGCCFWTDPKKPVFDPDCGG